MQFCGGTWGVPERFRKKNSSDPTTIKNFNLFSMKSRFHLSPANYIFCGFKISEVCSNLIVAGTKKISILNLKLFVLFINKVWESDVGWIWIGWMVRVNMQYVIRVSAKVLGSGLEFFLRVRGGMEDDYRVSPSDPTWPILSTGWRTLSPGWRTLSTGWRTLR